MVIRREVDRIGRRSDHRLALGVDRRRDVSASAAGDEGLRRRKPLIGGVRVGKTQLDGQPVDRSQVQRGFQTIDLGGRGVLEGCDRGYRPEGLNLKILVVVVEGGGFEAGPTCEATLQPDLIGVHEFRIDGRRGQACGGEDAGFEAPAIGAVDVQARVERIPH
ncbi:hypothetical protein D3C73_967760 [compost metagenome]